MAVERLAVDLFVVDRLAADPMVVVKVAVPSTVAKTDPSHPENSAKSLSKSDPGEQELVERRR